MKNIAILENSVVTNVVAVEDDATVAQLGGIDLLDSQAGIGWSYANGVFTAPPQPAPLPPTSLTPRQIRLVLTTAGLRTAVESAVAASSQDIRDAWEFSLEYRRTDPVLLAMASTLGITDAQLDELFVQGAAL